MVWYLRVVAWESLAMLADAVRAVGPLPAPHAYHMDGAGHGHVVPFGPMLQRRTEYATE